jgi:CRP/FNR family cyclic AMP-dependent transcriptional regulator
MPLEVFASNVGYLKIADIIAADDTRSVKLLNRLSKKRRFESGQQVYPMKFGEPMLIVVVEGTVNLFLRRRGRQTFLKRLEKGSLLGEMPSWAQRMLGTRAVAEGGCELRILDESSATKLKTGNLGLLLRLQELNALKLSENLELYVDLLSTFERRLARFLINKADEEGIVSGLRHADIAAALGAHRETVTRAVRSLVQKAWIESRRKRITLLDRDALRHFAS